MTTVLAQSDTKTHYKNLRIKFNVRYGLDEERLLDGYQSGIDDLKGSILKFGFKPNEPIEVYDSGEVNADGDVIYDIAEGHRRYLASLSIFEENPGKTLGDDLAPGEVRIFVSPKPENLLKLVSSQIGANKTEPNTKMDLCKAVHTAYNAMEGKTSEKLTKIGEELGLTRSMATYYRNVYELPTEVKDWIQLSEINPETDITISFTTALELVNYYKVEDAGKLLLRALEVVQSDPASVKTFGKSVTRDWLHELAGEIKLGKKPKEKKVSQLNNATDASQDQDDESDDDNQQQQSSTSNGKAESVAVTTSTNSAATERPKQPESTSTTAQLAKQPKQDKQPEQPMERIETLIRQKLKGDIGLAIANGKANVAEGKFIIEIDNLELGYEFSELVSAWLDPKSNDPVSVISNSSATAIIEETEF